MRVRLQLNQDVAAGMTFGACGAFFLWFGRNYEVGSALRMGPGYLPMLLGWLLVVIGGVLTGKGVVVGGERIGGWAVRPLLLVCGALFLFSWMLDSGGLVLTGTTAMLLAAAGGPEFKAREQVVLSITMSILAAMLFVTTLGLPMRIWPAFLGN